MEFIENKIGRQGIRKGIVVSVFLEFLIYVFLIFYHVIKYPQKNDGSYKTSKQKSFEEDKQMHQENQDKISKEPYSRQYLEERFRIFFLYHIVGVGFSILYASNSLEIILAYFHLISFCVIIAAKAKQKQSIMHLCTFFCYFIDIMLMISGTAGINIK